MNDPAMHYIEGQEAQIPSETPAQPVDGNFEGEGNPENTVPGT